MRHDRFETLAAFCKAMQWAVDTETVYQRIVDVSTEYFECDSAHLHMLDTYGKRFVRHASHDLSKTISDHEVDVTVGVGRMSQLIYDGELIVMDYMKPHEDDEIPDYAIELGFKSAISIPIGSNLGVFGMLSLVYMRELPFAEDDYDFLLEIGSVLAIFIQRVQMSKKDLEYQLLQERKQLSNEIHDNFSQAVSALALRADIASACLDDGDIPALSAEIESLAAQARQLTKMLRGEMLSLRMPVEDGGDVVSDISELLERFKEQWGYEVSLESCANGTTYVSEYARLQLIRIVNEALQNVLRHARATAIHATVERRGPKVVVGIHDNGVGFDADSVAPERLGLRIMHERAIAAGGSAAVASGPNGTAVTIEIPVTRT